MYVYAIPPHGGWRPGDRAYCVRGTTSTKPTLEAGKVYLVNDVIPVKNCVDDGLVLVGVSLPDHAEGLWSNRFVCLRGGESSLAQIDRASARGWCEAYYAIREQQAANPGDPS